LAIAKQVEAPKELPRLAKLRVLTDPIAITLFLIPLAVLSIFFLAPVLSVIASAFEFDWRLILTPFYISPVSIVSPVEVSSIGGTTLVVIQGFDFGVILNSLINAAMVTLFATVIGTSIAVLVGLYDFPGRRALMVLASLPLLVAPFVNSYVMKLLYGYTLQGNVVSAILNALGLHVRIGVTGLAGVTLAQTFAFYPIVYINALAALGAIDATLIEQALNLGSRGFRLLRTIVLPLMAPGIIAGATLVYILSLEDVGAPIVFNFHKMMSYQIFVFFQQYASVGILGSASALSVLLLVFTVIPVVFVRRYLSLRYYARLARGAPRPVKRLPLGPIGKAVAYLLVFPVAIAAAAPQIGILILAFAHRWVGPAPWGFTLKNYVVLFSWPGVVRGIINSLIYTPTAVALIAAIGFAAGYAIARLRIPGVSVLDVLSVAPLAVPGLVMAFGYFVFLHTIARGTILDPMVCPGAVLVVAYMVRKMPFTVRSVFTGLIQTPRALEEVAQCLSASRLRVLRDIVLPLTWRSIAAGLLLSAIYVLSEVSVSVTIGALGGDITVPNHAGPITFVIMRLIQSPSLIGGCQPQAVAAAMATILMGLEALVLFLATTRLARRGQMLISV